MLIDTGVITTGSLEATAPHLAAVRHVPYLCPVQLNNQIRKTVDDVGVCGIGATLTFLKPSTTPLPYLDHERRLEYQHRKGTSAPPGNRLN